MLEVVSLLIVLVMSLIITRVATVALALTGMTHEAARFQARSALTGAGFTTHESERVVNHPVRRRIIMALMLMGNTGLVLGASLMVILLAGDGHGLAQRWQQVTLLLGGLLALYAAARSTWLERWILPRAAAGGPGPARRGAGAAYSLGPAPTGRSASDSTRTICIPYSMSRASCTTQRLYARWMDSQGASTRSQRRPWESR